MTRPRDSQRARVYRAEDEVVFTKTSSLAMRTLPLTEYGSTRFGKGDRYYPSIGACQHYYNVLFELPWFKTRWSAPRLRVGAGTGGGTAYTNGVINLDSYNRHDKTLLHELAHILTPDDAGHGKEWAGVYLFLIERVIDKATADLMRQSFKSYKAKYNYSRVPKPRRLSNAQTIYQAPLKVSIKS